MRNNMSQNENISREQQFLAKLQETVKFAGKEGGVITREQIREIFEGLSLSDEQMNQVEDYLKANKIGIDEAPSLDEILTEEEHNYLEDYIEVLGQLERPSENVLDAIRLSAMAGEKSAQNQLAEAMLMQVVDIAKLYAGQGVYLEDLIGTGNEALMIGCSLLAPLEHPDEVDGFLAQRIMNAMEDLISENLDSKAIDKDLEEKVNLVADKARELAEMLGRKVTAQELANEGDVTLEEIQNAVRLTGGKIEDIE